MKKNTVNPESKNKHLVAAAKLLVEKIESPSVLLCFLTDILYQYHEYSIENYKAEEKMDLINNYNNITNLIEEFVIPWMKNGKDASHNIAKGIYNIYDYGHYSGYHETISYILLAHSYSFRSGIPPAESQQRALSIISTLSEIGNHIRYFDEEQKKKRQAA